MTTDPVSGVHDGILKRPETDPLVFQIDGGLEMWQWKGSLNVVDGAGEPVPVPDNVRLYYQTGAGHTRRIVGLLSPPRSPGICQYARQGNTGSMTVRALALAMDDWADRGIEPPKSNYPGLKKKELVTLDEYRAAFPAIPGVEPPSVLNELNVLDFGPLFGPEGGDQTLLPPLPGPSYTILVPKPDKDGVDDAGVRAIEVRVPLGTNVGWSVRAGFRAPDLCSLDGAYFPFAVTKDERQATGDPRKSLQERYKNHRGFVKSVEKAAKKLVKERFLLEEDAETYIQAARDSDVLR